MIYYLKSINSVNIYKLFWGHTKSFLVFISEQLDLISVWRYDCKPGTWLKLRIFSHQPMVHRKNKIYLINIDPRATSRRLGFLSLMYIKEGKRSKATVIMPWSFCLVYDIRSILQWLIVEFSRREAPYLRGSLKEWSTKYTISRSYKIKIAMAYIVLPIAGNHVYSKPIWNLMTKQIMLKADWESNL